MQTKEEILRDIFNLIDVSIYYLHESKRKMTIERYDLMVDFIWKSMKHLMASTGKFEVLFSLLEKPMNKCCKECNEEMYSLATGDFCTAYCRFKFEQRNE